MHPCFFLSIGISVNLRHLFVNNGLQENKTASDGDSDSDEDEDEVTPVQVNCNAFWFVMNAEYISCWPIVYAY